MRFNVLLFVQSFKEGTYKMTTGVALGILLAVGLAAWGVLDAGAWFLGLETFSQWVIGITQGNPFLAWGVIGIIVLFALWLIVHFELPKAVIIKVKTFMEEK